MKIMIIGAGELGRLLAKTLCASKHEVVVVDSSVEELERIGDRLDILRVEGSCASVATLKKAGIETADALLAVSGDEAANILACQIASRLGIKNTVCRLYSSDSISEKDGVGAADFGIWKTFSSPEASVRKILGVLDNPLVLEKIQFSHPNARMAVVQITRTSPIAGVRLRDISCGKIIDNIRIAALLRGDQFLIPHGDTIFTSGDKIYLTGHKDNVQEFIDWISNDAGSTKRRIVVAGACDTGLILAREAFAKGYDVRLIERNKRLAEKVLDDIPGGIMLIQGDPTDEDLLEEAGVNSADVFVSVAQDDEDNILSCIIAKRAGAKKVVVLTHKPEYIRIVPTMELIDCGFSASLISVNTVLRLLEGGTIRLDAILQNFNANLSEFKVLPNSPLVGKPLKDCGLPPSAVLALVFRSSEVLTPSGMTVLRPGDVAVAIVTSETMKELEPLFPKK